MRCAGRPRRTSRPLQLYDCCPVAKICQKSERKSDKMGAKNENLGNLEGEKC